MTARRFALAGFVATGLLSIGARPADAQQSTARRPVNTRAMSIRAEMAAVLLQSKRYDEAAREYSILRTLDPSNRAYRLGLARSLAWGKRLRAAEEQLLELSKDYPADPTVESLLYSVRSAMNPASGEAALWLRQQPASPTYRHILARALTREENTIGALAHYDTLLSTRPSPDLFIERASVHAERRDFVAAERDLNSSIRMAPTTEAFVLLGDVQRWRGDLSAARASYVRARAGRGDLPEVAAALGRLARDRRPAIAFIPDVTEPDAWETTNTTSSDDLGVSFTSLTLRRGLRSRHGFDVSGGIKASRLADRDPVLGGGEEGYGADLAFSREATHRQFHARARVRAGFLYHPSGDLAPEGAFALAAFAGAWGFGAEISTAPAYPALLTLASMQAPELNGALLREQTSAISVAGPVGKVDVAARHQSTSLSDGNARAGLQGYARAPAGRPLALVYSGSTMSYAHASGMYWSPERYVAHSVGVEFALRRLRGISFAARLLPGMAWIAERDSTAELLHHDGVQVAGGLDATYRTPKWEIGGGVSYGRGRAGEYERFDALLRARYLP